MSSPAATLYLTRMIRAGFEPQDVKMFDALCNQVKLDTGDSRTYMFLLLDMARHNKVDVMEIIKTGRVCSDQKSINEKFMKALHECLTSVDDEVEAGKPSAGVLDLTCDEELSESDSHSYEETSEPYNDNPTSAEAYELDGFVVEDHDSDADNDDRPPSPVGKRPPQKGVKRLLKRKISFAEIDYNGQDVPG